MSAINDALNKAMQQKKEASPSKEIKMGDAAGTSPKNLKKSKSGLETVAFVALFVVVGLIIVFLFNGKMAEHKARILVEQQLAQVSKDLAANQSVIDELTQKNVELDKKYNEQIALLESTTKDYEGKIEKFNIEKDALLAQIQSFKDEMAAKVTQATELVTQAPVAATAPAVPGSEPAATTASNT